MKKLFLSLTIALIVASIFATATFAAGMITWGGQGSNNLSDLACQQNGGLWVVQAKGATIVIVYVNGTAYPASQQGQGAWHADSGPIGPGTSAYALYAGNVHGNTGMELSHCNGVAVTPTNPPTATKEPTATATEPPTATATEPPTATATEPGVTPTEPGITPTEPGVTPTEPGITPTEPGTTPTAQVTPTQPPEVTATPGGGVSCKVFVAQRIQELKDRGQYDPTVHYDFERYCPPETAGNNWLTIILQWFVGLFH